MRAALSYAWNQAKIGRKLALGPVSLVYKLERTVRVSNNSLRRIARALRPARTSATLRSPAAAGSLRQDATPLPQQTRVDPAGESALIVGVGPGLGEALARRLHGQGMRVALASRNARRLDPLVDELSANSDRFVHAYGCDATNEKSVRELMAHVERDFGVPNLVVYSLQSFGPGRVLDIEVPAFEDSWRHNCLGAFIVAREAARMMVRRNRGTIVLVGSTSGLIAREDHLNLAVGKHGLRALAHIMARELSPQGIHVAHLVIDADIKENEEFAESIPQAEPEHIADLVHMLHKQAPSVWTSELDARPWNEKFWQHC